MSRTTEAGTAGLPLKLISASAQPDPSTRTANEYAILVDVSSCSGCKACEVACVAWHKLTPPIMKPQDLKADFSYASAPDLRPDLYMRMVYKEAKSQKGLHWFITKHQCMHCGDPGCLQACPAPGAVVKYANGVVDFNHEKCIGCKMCLAGCPFNIPRFDANSKPSKCNFCVDRVAAGITPACVKSCSTNALHFGLKQDMLDRGKKIAARLKERGYPDARLYDPPGVGGTNYVYVLPYGKATKLYAGLPAEPSVSLLVSLWKGPLKYLSGAAIIGTLAAVLIHYVTFGPKTEEHEGKEKK
jgi:formate dehydrogenase iron-sulfur subunit